MLLVAALLVAFLNLGHLDGHAPFAHTIQRRDPGKGRPPPQMFADLGQAELLAEDLKFGGFKVIADF